MSLLLAFIGFGEVGGTFSRDLLGSGVERIQAYDILLDGPDSSAAMLKRMADHGVEAKSSLAAAIADADVVFSAVTADQAEAVAGAAAPFLRGGQIFLDLNSASPSTKRRAAAIVEAGGADYVEGAVMAPVAEPRLAVPILGGGPGAERAAALLNPLGMSIRPVSAEHGRASAMKLCRSIMIKGLEALIIDCADASKAWGVEREVFASLGQSFPSIDWPKLAVTMRGRVEQHGRRRAAEMREAGEMLAALGLDPSLSLAVADRQERGAKR